MGAELSLSLALSVRKQARRHRPVNGDCASRDRALVSRSGGRAAGGGAVRRGVLSASATPSRDVAGQKNDRCTPANLLFDNPSTVDPTSSQPGDGDLFAISGRGAERDRGQCLSDHARLVVAAGYRRRG